jgi:FkbM family methyltransferase
LLANLELNDITNALVVVGAVSDTDGTITLPNQRATDKARLSLAGSVNDVATRYLVRTWTLNTLFSELALDRVKVLKVDVEGFEAAVFRGATKVLSKVDNIIFECLSENFDAEIGAIKPLLTVAGFELFDVRGAPLRQGVSPIEDNIWARRL